MASAGSIYVDLLLRDAKYTDGLRRAGNQSKRTFGEISRSAELAKGAIAGLAGALSIGALVAVGRNAIKVAGDIADMADSVGLSAESLQKFQFAANLAGVSAEQFQSAIAKLNNNIVEGNLSYSDTSTALLDIADKVKNAKSSLEQAAIVNEAFGAKLGSKLIPLLKDGSDGIKNLGLEATKLGAVLDEKTVRATEAFGDELDALGTVIARNFQQGFLTPLVTESGQLRDIYSDPNFINGIKDVGKALGDFVNFVLTHLPEATTILAAFAGATAGAAAGGAAGTVIPGIGNAAGALGGAVIGGGLAFAGAADATGLDKKIRKVQQLNAEIKKIESTPVDAAGLGSFVSGIGKTVDSIKSLNGTDLIKALSSPNTKNNVEKISTFTPRVRKGAGGKTEEQKQLEELNRLYEKNRQIITGVNDATFKYQETSADLLKLQQAGLITDAQRIDALQNLRAELYETNDAADETFQQLNTYGEEAARNVQDAFANFLFDPFQDGLKGMLKGFVDTLRKMVAEFASAQLLGGSKGGGLGGLFGSLFGGNNLSQSVGFATQGGFGPFQGFFADGGYIAPGSWGIAGEAGAEMIYGGKTGATVIPQGKSGNTYYIDAKGADNGAVVRIENALLQLAGPGVIEKRVVNAQKRGAL